VLDKYIVTRNARRPFTPRVYPCGRARVCCNETHWNKKSSRYVQICACPQHSRTHTSWSHWKQLWHSHWHQSIPLCCARCEWLLIDSCVICWMLMLPVAFSNLSRSFSLFKIVPEPFSKIVARITYEVQNGSGMWLGGLFHIMKLMFLINKKVVICQKWYSRKNGNKYVYSGRQQDVVCDLEWPWWSFELFQTLYIFKNVVYC